MSSEIFQSPKWFAHLWSNGFESQPKGYWLWDLTNDACTPTLCFHLVNSFSSDGLIGLSNYYSCLFGPEDDSDFLEHFSASQWARSIHLLRGIPNSDFITFQPLNAEKKWINGLQKAFVQNGFFTLKFFCFGNWYQPVSENGFLPYWADRPSALRGSVSRGKRRLDAAGNWRIDIHTPYSHARLGSIDDAIIAYEKVYSHSWKSPEPCANFIPGLVRMAAQQGWLRLGILWLDGKPAAAQLWFVDNGKASIYKLAYTQGLERFSVGSVLTAALMQHVMDLDQVKEVDYLSGDDAYKADWMSHRRERIGIAAFDLLKFKGWYQLSKFLSLKIINKIKLLFHKF